MFSPLAEEGIEPAVPELMGGAGERRRVAGGGGTEFRNAYASGAEFASVSDVPTFEALDGDLGVKLQAEREVPKRKCLIPVELRFCETRRTRRDVECISMPMK